MDTNSNIFKGTSTQLLAAATGTLAAISDGMHYGWTAPVIPILLSDESPVETTMHQAEWLETMLMLGAFCGLPGTIYFVDKIGRKYSLLLSSMTTLLCWTVIGVANRIEYIFAARFFSGMAGDMAFVAAPMYIAEIADQKIRGFLSSIIYLMMLIGIFLIYAIAPYTPFYVPCIIGGALVVVELIVFPFMPESPYYLLSKDRPEEAKHALTRFRQTKNIEKEFEEISIAVKRQRSERGRPHDLILVKSNRKALLIMTVLNGSQHFSSISVILMNLHLILEAAGSIYIDPSLAAIIFSIIMFTAACTASFSIDKFGRKVLLTTSSILTGCCLLIIAIYFTLKNTGYDVLPVSWIPIVSVMVYAASFKLGLGMVPIVMTAELFPTKMKAIGMTLADAMYVIFAIFSIQIYQLLSDAYGIHVPFYIFAFSCFGTAIFTTFVIPETKGKTLEEIQFILKGVVPPPSTVEEKEEFI
ncbi:unnamed protein product [Brassicogethes aeneus]|uniref:Major facilitator superfamily (MFS) profile domain-containing protein n=1 Tax=Brassicogethes aeneus TaxID=1431903 RepID=A0A9P0B6J5_BRAAE|nr:unnamed protein product [Brassicogethes aeneus]